MKISDADKRLLVSVDLLKTNYSAKINEIESKIPSISDLATNAALAAVEDEISEVSNFFTKQIMTQDYQALNLNILIQLITKNL